MKYVDTKIVFSEVPDEITLAINISNCPCHCKGCHSPYLADNIGSELDWPSLKKNILRNEGITCIAFMGGDSNPRQINDLARAIITYYPHLKVAWYSGRQELSQEIELKNFDFIKLGPYIEEFGPLNNKKTNQRFYEIVRNRMVDKTWRFWK